MTEKSNTEKFCQECGKTINERAVICPKCGVRQPGISAALNGKSRITAALFAFFLGGFGAHKFYLGQVGVGFIYILFFWTLIPALIAFIEFIIFLTMTDEAFIEKYGDL